ncbi:hypothetical protein ONJ23_27760, partial [Salmonella enterica subsp. enterica serovar Virginia]|nr:hypothetical protein [Salmonella enterica subsp. enterica serovar Virginia]
SRMPEGLAGGTEGIFDPKASQKYADADLNDVTLHSEVSLPFDGDLHYLSAKFSNIQRSITLGALRRVEEGETNGRLWGARLTS